MIREPDWTDFHLRLYCLRQEDNETVRVSSLFRATIKPGNLLPGKFDLGRRMKAGPSGGRTEVLCARATEDS